MKWIFILGLSAFLSPAHAEFIPEASGVCELGTTLVIAGDEEPKSLWLQDEGGALMKVKVQQAKWDDLEDLSAVDDTRFFAVTSHGRTKSGKRRPEREQLLLISKAQNQLSVKASWSLRESILALLRQRLAQEIDHQVVEGASPDQGGLNIEGMAYVGGKLYLGLRSPLTSKGEAIVLVVRNGQALLSGGTPEFSDVWRINLAGRGIRGLAVLNEALLILGGSSDDRDLKFSLDRLTLSSQQVEDFPLPRFSTLLRPEGIVVRKDGSITLAQDFKSPESQDVLVRLTE